LKLLKICGQIDGRRVSNDSDPKAVLIGIFNKFSIRIERLDLLPKLRNSIGSVTSIPAVASFVVRYNVMEDDQSTLTNKSAITQKVLAHALVGTVAINKEEIKTAAS
jgi:hypothetical protein